MTSKVIVDVVFDFGDLGDLDDYSGRDYHEVLRDLTTEMLMHRLDAICRCQDVLFALPETTDAQTDALQAEWDTVSKELRSRPTA